MWRDWHAALWPRAKVLIALNTRQYPNSHFALKDDPMSLQSAALSDEAISRLFGVMLSELSSLGITGAQRAVEAAGITGVNVSEQYWYPFRVGVEAAFYKLKRDARLAALRVLGSRLSDNDQVRHLLMEHGFEYIDGTFVPTGLLDQREARYLPPSSASELAKAMKRLVDGDETGAITSACGAVDTLMQHLYTKPPLSSLGDPKDFAFASKVNTAASRLGIFEEIAREFAALGMKHDDIDAVIMEMRKATNHAAQMLQTLRRTMGDVHGSKPALRRTAYDAIKWASAICGLFEGR